MAAYAWRVAQSRVERGLLWQFPINILSMSWGFRGGGNDAITGAGGGVLFWCAPSVVKVETAHLAYQN